MKICVVGLGYIGLPTASFLATKGFDVLGVDVKPEVVATLNEGNIHIFEPSLDILVKSAVGSGKLKASTEPGPADIFVIAVPTPFQEGFKPDVSYVETAARTLARYVGPGSLVILESTSPVGTTERVAEIIREARPDLDVPVFGTAARALSVHFAHCPERVLPGRILQELVENDRIVGGINPESTAKAAEFYRSFVSGKVFTTDCRTAELSKLTENAYRDVNIAFANELSLICTRLRIDIWETIKLANRHPRVNILNPGPGVGGHCIAVDPWFIVHAAPEESKLIRAAREVNDSKPAFVVDSALEIAAKFREPRIACLGLTYKPDVDDTRESPSIHVTRDLALRLGTHGTVMAVDPMLKELPQELAGSSVKLVPLSDALESCDILVTLTGHSEFKSIDQRVLSRKMVLDVCGLWRSAVSKS